MVAVTVPKENDIENPVGIKVEAIPQPKSPQVDLPQPVLTTPDIETEPTVADIPIPVGEALSFAVFTPQLKSPQLALPQPVFTSALIVTDPRLAVKPIPVKSTCTKFSLSPQTC